MEEGAKLQMASSQEMDRHSCAYFYSHVQDMFEFFLYRLYRLCEDPGAWFPIAVVCQIALQAASDYLTATRQGSSPLVLLKLFTYPERLLSSPQHHSI